MNVENVQVTKIDSNRPVVVHSIKPGTLVVCQDDVYTTDETELLLSKDSQCIFVQEVSTVRRGTLGYVVFAPDGRKIALGTGAEIIGSSDDFLVVVRARVPGAPMYGRLLANAP